ncbi:O-antigen ligase family protein [bacterium]|nr:O-antigen ligase family protein [bacterium]
MGKNVQTPSMLFPRRSLPLAVPGIVILSVFMGLIVYLTVSGGISLFYTGILFFIILLPFLLIWHRYAKKMLIVLLVLTIPLIIDKTLNLHEFHQGGAKGYIISLHDIAIVLLYIVLFFEMFRKREIKLKSMASYTIPFIGIIIMAALSMIQAQYRHFSLYEGLELIKMFFIFFFVANYVRDSGDYRIILAVLIAGLAIQVLFVTIEVASGGSFGVALLGTRAVEDPYAQPFFRVGGTFGGANGLAWYLDAVLPVVIAVYFTRMRPLKRVLLTPVLAGGIAVLIMTFSRGGWLGFAVGCTLVMIIFFFRTDRKNKVRIGVFAVLMAVLITALLAGTENPVRERLTADDRGSASSRLPLIVVALDMIKHHPLNGVGLNNYTEVHHQYDFGVDKITEYYPVPVHNIFLMIAAEIGLPGLLFFLVFLFAVYRKSLLYAFRNSGLPALTVIGIAGGITAFLVQGMVQNSSFGSVNFYPFWILSATAAGIVERGNV